MVDTSTLIVRGPETVTWRVVLDPLMMVAGVRALMLQALQPTTMRGVWQNSDFLERPLERLFNTAHFVTVTALGTPEQADALGARVRAVHRTLRIKDPETGRTHRVDEPELLLWVHCAEVSSYLEVIERGGLRLTPAERDRYYDEQRRTATYVGLHAEDVPGSVAEMDGYFERARAELDLRVTDEARATMRFLLWPKMPGKLRVLAPFKPMWLPIGMLAYYTLPRWARDEYRTLPEVRGVQPVVTFGLKVGRFLVGLIPERIAGRPFKPETRDLMADLPRRLTESGVRPHRKLQKVRAA
ncbi:oxygenase MpaB family protein [Actinomadura rupiterrae]|uniref:oxygenase MpaB family protein n=1 Tax=Actinomadura rupiterrae TaxID=559627 RepID=UPI0020A52331|nr:oxygenase MpaB family protein [Actinomadura rupiterrae]